MKIEEIAQAIDKLIVLQIKQMDAFEALRDDSSGLKNLVAQVADANSKLTLAQSIATRDLWMELKTFREQSTAQYEEAREEVKNIDARLSLILTEIEFLKFKFKN